MCRFLFFPLTNVYWIENILQKNIIEKKVFLLLGNYGKIFIFCHFRKLENFQIFIGYKSKVTMKLHNVQILFCISNVKEIYPKTECIGSVLKGGHDVPIGTMVFVNLWSLHNDADVWKDVDIFDPYRYLDKNGKLDVKPSNWLPFGTGRRVSRGAVS